MTEDTRSSTMNLRDDGKKAAPVREQMNRAREKWVDMQSRIRRRMRVYPKKLRDLMASREREIDESELRSPPGGSEPSHDPEARPQRTPIVSIRGRDLEQRDLEKNDIEHPLAS